MKTQALLVATSSNVNVSSQSLADCLKGTSGFFGTNYVNICTGVTAYVPAGFWDYAMYGVLIFVGIMFGLFLLKILLD